MRFTHVQQELWTGKAKLVPDAKVKKALGNIQKNLLKSDDEHTIALALTANVDLLCTEDRKLQIDFKNKDIMGWKKQRKGKIYTKASHKKLLHRDRCP